jgi:predicted ATPase
MLGSGGAKVDGELLERVHELKVLDRLVERVHSGHPAVALVEGPAGIGKSRLLNARLGLTEILKRAAPA